MSNSENFVITGTGSFLHVFEPAFQNKKQTGDKKFSMSLIVDDSQVAIIKQHLGALVAETFTKGEAEKVSFKWPIRPCSEIDAYKDEPRFEGKFAISAKSNVDYPPAVLGMDRQPVVNKSLIYSGAEYAVGINLFSYDNDSTGISAGLKAVMKTADGEPLGATAVNTDTLFADVTTSGTEGTGATPEPNAMPGMPDFLS